MQKGILLTLHTLKAEPLQKQVETIERFARNLPDLSGKIRPLLSKGSEDSIVRTYVDEDSVRLVQFALMAVVATDVAITPLHTLYDSALQRLCKAFEIEESDLLAMVRHVDRIEELLSREGAFS